MTTYVWRDGKLVPKIVAEPLFLRGPRSHDVALPHFVSDKLWDVRGQHDGRVYDSKSALRAAYRRGGYTEIGNDAPLDTGHRTPEVKADLVDAYRKVKDGYRPALLETGVLPEECV